MMYGFADYNEGSLTERTHAVRWTRGHTSSREPGNKRFAVA